MAFQPGWQALLLNGLPFTDETSALDAMLARFGDLPSWPQLPRRSPLENMYTMFSEGFPGLREDAGGAFVEHGAILDRELGELHLAYLDDDVAHGRISPSHARGLDALLHHEPIIPAPVAVKGEITGPVSWSLTMLDEQRRPLLYDPLLESATAQHLRLKATWQEQQLRKIAPETIMLLNEPYMASFGSSFVPISRQEAVALFNEVLAGIQGIGGMHCCGATDWSVILETRAQLISWDAYDYMGPLLEYAEPLAAFLERDGILCWGIVPSGYAARWETVDNLVKRLEQGLDALAARGIPRELAVQRSLLSPSCGLSSLDIELAEHILELTQGVSQAMQHKYADQGQNLDEPTDVSATPTTTSTDGGAS